MPDRVSVLGHKFVWQHNDVVGQAMVRIFFCLVCSTYAYVAWRNSWFGAPPAQLFYVSVLFLGISIFLLFFAGFTRSMTWPFKTGGMTADISFTTYAMIIGDTSTIFLYGIFLWIIIGNGLRFGRNCMYVANVLSIIGFSIVIANGVFWQQHPYVGGGLMLWLVLMPIYISKLLRKLEVAVEQADRANNAKSQFLANMSHEIRTPMTSIIGFAETALDDDQTTPQRISALQTIRSSGDHLLNLINDILDFSKIDAGELQIEHIKMNPLQTVSEVQTIIQNQISKKSIDYYVDYEFPLPGCIESDPVRLKQILLNLCSNAIKFTEQGSIHLGVRYDSDAEILIFTVTDTGIGMRKDQIEKVFKPFKQADSSITRRFGGTGLGLSLSNQLTELLGGEINVHSDLGKGTSFELQIPCKGVLQEDIVTDTTGIIEEKPCCKKSRPELLSGNILLAEDNDVNQLLISCFLEKMGATVFVASNGQAAVELAQINDFDLIYMDMQMPIMSGVDAVLTLRGENYSGPIVALTANATEDDRRLCIEAGFDDFITKPIVRETLYNVTARYLDPQASNTTVQSVECSGK